jgi:tetratricopeptide (TPR) repeat protein
MAVESIAIANEDAILKMKYAYPQRDEYVYLPEFCIPRVEGIKLKQENRDKPPSLIKAAKAWEKKLGGTTWLYLHHYCGGVNQIGRYERSLAAGVGNKQNMTKMQKATLINALGNFKMIEPPYRKVNSPLYASTIINHAKAFNLLGRKQEAILKLKEGISAEPSKDILYLNLAQIFLEVGDKNQAKQVLETGYKQTGGSKRIGAMLSDLK